MTSEKTDREIVEDLFMRRGIEFTAEGNTLRLNAKTKGVYGYWGFVTTFEFKESGDLEKIGIWE